MALTTTPAQVIEGWLDLGLSEVDLVRALTIDMRTLKRWRSGESYPQHDAREALAGLEDLRRQMTETFEESDAARTWLRAASRYLSGLTPADTLRAGRLDRFRAALEALDAGIFV